MKRNRRKKKTVPHRMEAGHHFIQSSAILVELLQRPVQQGNQSSILTGRLFPHTQLNKNGWLQTLATHTHTKKNEPWPKSRGGQHWPVFATPPLTVGASGGPGTPPSPEGHQQKNNTCRQTDTHLIRRIRPTADRLHLVTVKDFKKKFMLLGC